MWGLPLARRRKTSVRGQCVEGCELCVHVSHYPVFHTDAYCVRPFFFSAPIFLARRSHVPHAITVILARFVPVAQGLPIYWA